MIISSPGALVNSQFNPAMQITENAPKNAASQDTVSVSDEALLLTESLRSAQSAPDIREDKVASLKAAIESGTYNINARLIAEKIAAEETSLFI